MTREEAIMIVPHKTGTVEGTISLINEIFDDFESRTCESCRRKQSCEAFASAWNQYKVDCNEFVCSLWEEKEK